MLQAEIICTNLTKKFAGSTKKEKGFALDNLSLKVEHGEVYGFLGPNGAGKSTTIKLLLQFIRPDLGDIYIAGKKVGTDEFRHLIGFLPEFPCFYSHLTARETLRYASQLSGKNISDDQTISLLDHVNLKMAARQKIGTFSKGMKQRLGFAVAMVHDPEIFIFDEPMSGLDPIGRHLVKNVIHQLRNQGKTIFFSSHILSDVEDLCDKIGIVHLGKMLYQGDIKSFVQKDDLEKKFVELINKNNQIIQ